MSGNVSILKVSMLMILVLLFCKNIIIPGPGQTSATGTETMRSRYCNRYCYEFAKICLQSCDTLDYRMVDSCRRIFCSIQTRRCLNMCLNPENSWNPKLTLWYSSANWIFYRNNGSLLEISVFCELPGSSAS